METAVLLPLTIGARMSLMNASDNRYGVRNIACIDPGICGGNARDGAGHNLSQKGDIVGFELTQRT
jgi:hypothetical protein